MPAIWKGKGDDYLSRKQKKKRRKQKKAERAAAKPKPIKKTVSKKFYQSWAWKEVRYKALMQSGRRCLCCGVTSKDARLVVDHIKPRSKYPELELDLNNLQVLCNACNVGKSNKDETNFELLELEEQRSEEEIFWRNNL